MKIRKFLMLMGVLVALSPSVDAAPGEIEVGVLINRVIAGEDFVGEEVTITGIALNDTTANDRLVNIGTKATYDSSTYLNFVSVYDTSASIKKGKRVSMRVKVETASAHNLGQQQIVMIETAFLECVSC